MRGKGLYAIDWVPRQSTGATPRLQQIGPKPYLAVWARVIGNYSKRGKQLSDNSPMEGLMFLGFATRD